MATSDRGTQPARTDDSASRIHAAEFVTVSTSPTADAIAASATLVGALQAQSIPFHVRVGPAPAPRFAERVATIAVGDEASGDADVHLGSPAAAAAADLAVTLGADPDPIRSVLGTCTWEHPGHEIEGAGSTKEELPRSDGIGIPVEDVHDGIAHSTLLRGPWSGADASADIPEGAANDGELGSLVAVEALQASARPERAADAIDRALSPIPTPDGPFATADGFADVLDVLAAVDPGTALAAACDPACRPGAMLDPWRTAAEAVHARLSEGPSTDDGRVVLYRDAGPAPHVVARLARDFETPAQIVAAVAGETVAVATADPEPIDRLVDTRPEPIDRWYRHGQCVLGGGHGVEPDAAEASLLEALA